MEEGRAVMGEVEGLRNSRGGRKGGGTVCLAVRLVSSSIGVPHLFG